MNVTEWKAPGNEQLDFGRNCTLYGMWLAAFMSPDRWNQDYGWALGINTMRSIVLLNASLPLGWQPPSVNQAANWWVEAYIPSSNITNCPVFPPPDSYCYQWQQHWLSFNQYLFVIPAQKCKAQMCKAMARTGNPDLAGIGVRKSSRSSCISLVKEDQRHNTEAYFAISDHHLLYLRGHYGDNLLPRIRIGQHTPQTLASRLLKQQALERDELITNPLQNRVHDRRLPSHGQAIFRKRCLPLHRHASRCRLYHLYGQEYPCDPPQFTSKYSYSFRLLRRQTHLTLFSILHFPRCYPLPP